MSYNLDWLENDESSIVSKKGNTEIKKERLHPPRASTPAQKTQKISDNFFVELAQSTEFKRFIYKVLYGKVHRTEKQHGNLDEKVKVGLQVFQSQKFGAVVKEMKDKFKNGSFKPSEII